MSDLNTLFLSTRGRIGRQTYWLALAVLFVANLIASLIPVIGAVAALTLLWPTACVFSKRLHDMGRSSWPAIGVTATSALFGLVAVIISLLATNPATVGFALAMAAAPVLLGGLVALAGLALVIWAGVGASDVGANRYGVETLAFPIRF